MRKIWYEKAWEDYLYWQAADKKLLKRQESAGWEKKAFKSCLP